MRFRKLDETTAQLTNLHLARTFGVDAMPIAAIGSTTQLLIVLPAHAQQLIRRFGRYEVNCKVEGVERKPVFFACHKTV
jgi:hypothetical protein